jgi:AraC-like DNA-binding protein
MNNCYLNWLSDFQASLFLSAGANLADSKQTVDVILPNMSLLGYVVPVESLGLGLLVCLLVYFLLDYNTRLQSHEKYKLTVNMIHAVHTPLLLLQNQLEDIKTDNLSESLSPKIEEALRYTRCVIDCNHNVATLDKENGKIKPKTSTINFELFTYITSIVNQCRPYAKSRRIQLIVSECPDCVSCRINENIMTAALQHLLNKMIQKSAPGCCIFIKIAHTINSWKLYISNHKMLEKEGKRMLPFIPLMLPLYGFSGLRTVRKIIHFHGGKITGFGYGKTVTFRIIIPTDCNCQNQSCPARKNVADGVKGSFGSSSRNADNMSRNAKIKDAPCVLLVMADRRLSNYLKKDLSRYFRIEVLDNPELLIRTTIHLNPDAIIIDDNVNGISGDALCFRIKTDKIVGDMPVVLLIRSFDNESYMSHMGSGADRLELRMESICKFRANICMLIENHMTMRERIKCFLSDTVTSLMPVQEELAKEDLEFMEKVNAILEENLAEKYSIEQLCTDVGKSRTAFYSKMRELTGKSPESYIYSFKMDKARIFLASQQYTNSEIAGMLGYCDAKYFGKKFKEFYNICPSDYIKSIIG